MKHFIDYQSNISMTNMKRTKIIIEICENKVKMCTFLRENNLYNLHFAQ